MINNFKYTEAVNFALKQIMSSKTKSVCMGLGINDPKRIFGTTKDLLEDFGPTRSIEPPTSENALTGIAFGMALQSYSVCLIHQRMDFALLSFDQIINTIAKWSFMFDKEFETSFLIRMIIGRGWGQGPTHSQSYHSFLSSIPGLDVYYPTSPSRAFSTIQKTMRGKTPSVMIEHRWLHNSQEEFDISDSENSTNLDFRIETTGKDLTIFTYGYMLLEAKKAVQFLSKDGYEVELISTDTLKLNNINILINSLIKTRKILFIEPFNLECSFTASLISEMTKFIISNNIKLQFMEVLSLPFEQESTSFFDTKKRYKNWIDIVKIITLKLQLKEINISYQDKPHDIPGEWFKGPF